MSHPGFSAAMLHPRNWPMWAGLGLLWLCIQLPYPTILAVGRLLGRAMYHVMPERRHIAETNLQLCFPQWSNERRAQVLRENFESNGIALFEMAMAWWWPPKRLARLAHIEGLEHLQQASAARRGAVLMSMHFTTLEIGAALLGQKATIDGMYREHGNAAFDFVQRRGRERHNADAIAVEREDVRSMLKSMRSGRAIWYAPDQDYGRKASVFVPLFGVQAATVTATSTFARLGKALVIPFTQTRLPNAQGYQLTIHAPLENFPSGDETADALRINQWVEQAILQQPEQYMWVHRRFKTRPEGEARPYPKRRRRKRKPR
ncbi:lipid A biosynthesis lauroyl acyltransferase [Halopseudomonas nanhaiensis]|uniref:lipid A biosynthesis lauroyl acyltransferase n=1 Tax=Halopseudomonas nanhaiensis TaxID=2830842 RepID=UPI001CBFDD84|nr:lipid A biosynthesis lauroyl acyltransferase [Halopseudomonas nanhaiensis]UAW97466.1 lipid A biosynthesis lauroyl acyltransferase [Halopseudomonas nanhaiensis]